MIGLPMMVTIWWWISRFQGKYGSVLDSYRTSTRFVPTNILTKFGKNLTGQRKQTTFVNNTMVAQASQSVAIICLVERLLNRHTETT